MRRRYFLGCAFAAAAFAGPASAADPLPEGDVGIAAQYDGDVGIGGDPEVILFEDFEGYTQSSDLDAQWESVHQYDQISFPSGGDNVFAGEQSVQLTVPQQDQELSNGLTKWVSPELDTLFLRYYSKFDAPYDVVGSSHNGSMISAHYYEGHNATPGVPANGTNKWLANLENYRGDPAEPSPGLLNIYIYHPDQRSNYGDHFFPSGLVMPNTSLPFDFGEDFVPYDEFMPTLQQWYCYEFMVQANTPGVADGRIAAWIDGALVGDWTNLRLRDVPELTIDRFGIGFHIGSNPNGETHKWYDNVVAARSYIGPIGDGTPGGETGDESDGGNDDAADGATDDGAASDGGVDETGGGPGGGSAGDGPGDGGGATDPDASGGDGTGESAGQSGGDEDGCACTAGTRRSPWSALGLLALLGLRRRRRA